MIGLAYGPAPTIPGVYVLTLVILVLFWFRRKFSLFWLHVAGIFRIKTEW